MKVLVVVEDDRDIRFLVRIHFGGDPAFDLQGEATDVEGGLAEAAAHDPDLIILDHRLEGPETGLEAAPRFKVVAPRSHIILFSASEELRVPALSEPAIDAFLLKTQIDQLVPLSRRLLGLDAGSTR